MPCPLCPQHKLHYNDEIQVSGTFGRCIWRKMTRFQHVRLLLDCQRDGGLKQGNAVANEHRTVRLIVFQDSLCQ